ncbi:hypothetical protein YC2023_084108 [Brassica napus]
MKVVSDENLEDSALPNPCALVHVTSRKKPSSIRQDSPVVRITNERQIECLMAKLGENDLSGEVTCTHLDRRVVDNVHRDESNVHLRNP